MRQYKFTSDHWFEFKCAFEYFNLKCMIGCLVIQFEKNGGLLAHGAADQPDEP